MNLNLVDPLVLLDAQSLLKPIMIRRLKREVATKLPKKTETQIKCRLAPYQAHWYKMLLASNSGVLDRLAHEARLKPDEALVKEAADGDLCAGDAQVLHEDARLDADGNVDAAQLAHIQHVDSMSASGSSLSKANLKKKEDSDNFDNFGLGEAMKVAEDAGNEWRKLMNLMMQLRKCCNHPYILPHAEPENAPRDSIIDTSGKMQMLEKLLAKLFAGRHRVLIFSSFLGMLDLLERFCELKKYKYLRLDGATNRVQRKFDIHRFNTGDQYFIYLISTRAGGLGINLQVSRRLRARVAPCMAP